MTDALLFREHEAEEIDEWPEYVRKLGKSTLLWIDLERPGDEEIARLGEALELADESLSHLTGNDVETRQSTRWISCRSPRGTKAVTWR